MFTQKHFVQIAKSIHLAVKDITTNFHPSEQDAALRTLSVLVGTMVSTFEKDNPRFKKDMFLHIVRTGESMASTPTVVASPPEEFTSAPLAGSLLMAISEDTGELEFVDDGTADEM